MRTLYIECNMGVAGDMLMAALLELLPDRAGFIAALNDIGVEGAHVHAEAAVKCGVSGTGVRVHVHGEEEHSHDVKHGHHHDHDHHHAPHNGHDHEHHHAPHHDHDHDHDHHHDHDHGHDHDHHHDDHNHAHNGMHEISALIDSLRVNSSVKAHIAAVYELIAAAEAEVHATAVNEIHFHEVGALDALIDIAGVCMLIDLIAPERIIASPVTTGFGQVWCAHGILPVPAPATALLLKGIPARPGRIEGELATPTGVALLRHFVQSFEEAPVMSVETVGYGMGKKDFDAANCVRAFIGETQEGGGHISELCCNLDDMTPEAIGFAMQVLFENGALDVFTTPAQMKKNRPGTLLTCLCKGQDAPELSRLMLRHTSTAGVREKICRRYMLKPSFVEVETAYGAISIKRYEGYGFVKHKPEFGEVAEAARRHFVPFEEVQRAALQAFEALDNR